MRGWEVIAFLNDGKTLRNTIRGIEFSGPDFDGMSPVNGSIIPALQPASWWEWSMTQVEIDKGLEQLSCELGDRHIGDCKDDRSQDRF